MAYRHISADSELFEILRRFATVSAKLHDGEPDKQDLLRQRQELVTEASQHGFLISEEMQARVDQRLLSKRHH